MIRTLLTLTVALLASVAQAETVALNETNTVTFRGVVDYDTVAKAQVELMKKAEAGKPLYLVLDTPGGSVDAGNRLIDTINGLSVKVHTITLFAASMGFNIAQASGDRLIIPTGELMSHRARGGVQGEIPGSIQVRLNHYLVMLDGMHETSAKRMGLSLSQYHGLIKDEYWTFGERAVKEKAADRVVTAKCSSELANGTESITILTLFGALKVTMSTCPLVSGPLGVDLAGISKENQVNALNYVNLLFSNKVEFFARYIRSGASR